MTRIKSITDIGSLYESIYHEDQDLIQEKKSSNKFPKGTFPKAGEETKEPKTMKDSGPNNVKGFKKMKKNKKRSGKKVHENINNFMKSKFDKLFENVMDDEMDVNMDLGPGAGPEGDMDMDVDTDTDMDTDMGSEEVTLTLDRETAQKLCDMLQSQLDGDNGMADSDEDSDLEDLDIDVDSESNDSDTEDEDEEHEYSDEDEEEDEDEMKEEVEAEKLSDEHGKKLAGHDNKVAGTLKSASKGKASTDVTKASDLTSLGDKGHALTKSGSNKVNSNLKQGQSYFR